MDDEACPKCGHSPTHYRRCSQIGCEDGYIDMHEYDDPLWYDEGEEEMCDECHGTGIECWCPSCGYDLQEARITQDAPDSANVPRPGYLGNINPVGADPDVP